MLEVLDWMAESESPSLHTWQIPLDSTTSHTRHQVLANDATLDVYRSLHESRFQPRSQRTVKE